MSKKRVEKPADFDRYWNGILEIVERCSVEVSMEAWERCDPGAEDEYLIDGGPLPEKNRDDVSPFEFRWTGRPVLAGMKVYRVKFSSYDGQMVGGMLFLPRYSGGPFPLIVHFAGYGGEALAHQDFVSAGYAVFDFSHRGMVFGSEGFDRYLPFPLLVRDVEDRRSYVYRSIVIDCLLGIRAAQGLASVDGNRTSVMGTSQGGGLALITAGLNKDIRVLSADLPWLTDFSYQLEHDVEGPYNELKEYFERFPEKIEPALATLGYFDTLSFAERISCPCLVSLGVEDRVCPPGSIRELFSRLNPLKTLMEIPGMAHERSTVWRALTRSWFDFLL